MGIGEQQVTQFEVTSTVTGSRVVVDGQDVSAQVIAVQFEVSPGRWPVLTLHGPAVGGIRGAGVVQVAAEDDAQNVREFLAGIDPEELERVALDRLDLDAGAGGLTAAMLRQLSEWSQRG